MAYIQELCHSLETVAECGESHKCGSFFCCCFLKREIHGKGEALCIYHTDAYLPYPSLVLRGKDMLRSRRR